MCVLFFFFFKQKTAYEMRISDWSSDVCSSDLGAIAAIEAFDRGRALPDRGAHAIHRGVAAADYHHALARRIEPAVVEGGHGIAIALAVRGDQIIERPDDTRAADAGRADPARLVDAGGAESGSAPWRERGGPTGWN